MKRSTRAPDAEIAAELHPTSQSGLLEDFRAAILPHIGPAQHSSAALLVAGVCGIVLGVVLSLFLSGACSLSPSERC